MVLERDPLPAPRGLGEPKIPLPSAIRPCPAGTPVPPGPISGGPHGSMAGLHAGSMAGAWHDWGGARRDHICVWIRRRILRAGSPIAWPLGFSPPPGHPLPPTKGSLS